jgi:signal transduction histidine kinase
VDRWLATLPEVRNLAATRHKAKRVVERGGSKVVLGYSATAVTSEQSGTHYTVVLQDVTERERLREERDRLMRLAAVSEILPSLLHELKNPLACIATAVEVMLEELAPGHLQTDLHAVLSEIRRMKFTLEGLGSVGRELASSRNHPIDHAAREVCRVLERQAASRGIQLTTRVADMPLLPLDPGVTRAVLFNLLTNSIHACVEGDSVDVGGYFDEPENQLVLWVEDTGCGMEPAVLDRCQELFFTTKPKGTGIGLALCSGAIASAGGKLDIRSEAARGTRVEIKVPIGKVHNHEHGASVGTLQARFGEANEALPKSPSGDPFQTGQGTGELRCHVRNN